jgi:hypothetical protein
MSRKARSTNVQQTSRNKTDSPKAHQEFIGRAGSIVGTGRVRVVLELQAIFFDDVDATTRNHCVLQLLLSSSLYALLRGSILQYLPMGQTKLD